METAQRFVLKNIFKILGELRRQVNGVSFGGQLRGSKWIWPQAGRHTADEARGFAKIKHRTSDPVRC